MFATTAAKVQNPTKVNAVSLHSHRSRKTTFKRNVSVRAEAQKTIDMNEVSGWVFLFPFFCVLFVFPRSSSNTSGFHVLPRTLEDERERRDLSRDIG